MLKEDVGIRFKAFRLDQKKAQHIMAEELRVHQSTITNIEHGTTFPKINYLFYFYDVYGLNINWLITGVGDMYLRGKSTERLDEEIKLPRVPYAEAKYSQYMELSRLIQVQVIEQVLLAKLSECKILFKDEVREFFERQKREQLEKEQKRAELLMEAEEESK